MVKEQKIGAIIQARYDSSRLPGKVLMKLPYGGEYTVLGHIIKQLAKIDIIDEIIIATSSERNDDPIAEEGRKLNVKVFRGSKENVLERFYLASQKFNLSYAIRLTGDNPIILVDLLDKVIKNHISNQYDYSRNIGLPYGTSFEILKVATLREIIQINPSEEECEHVTLYIKNNKTKFHINEENHDFGIDHSHLRLTVDYPSDYALMNILMTELEKTYFRYTLKDIFNFFNNNPFLCEINSNNIQKKQFSNSKEEIKEATEILKKFSMHRSQNILENYLISMNPG